MITSPLQRLTYLLVSLFLAHFTSTVIAQDNGNQEKLPGQIVVRLNFKLLDWTVIDDTTILTNKVKDFLNDEGQKELLRFAKKRFDLGDLTAVKLFPHILTKDSISISRLGEEVYVPPFWATFLISKPEKTDFWEFHRALNKEFYPLVIYADAPLEIIPQNLPNDEYFQNQTSLHNLGSPETSINISGAWEEETGKRFIKVGVYDSGIDDSHPDIKVLTGKGYFHATTPTAPIGHDAAGHGTSVAGIIGAKRENEIGIAGIAGGDGNDTSGVSLIDFKLGFGEPFGAISHSVMVAIIDGARSVGTYYDWSNSIIAPNDEYEEWMHAQGFGLNLANHSYGIGIKSPLSPIDGKDIVQDDSLVQPFCFLQYECYLCREAYLFSLRNGVTNVVARGNRVNYNLPPNVANNDLTYPNKLIPSAYFDDSWYIGVGASGMDGKRLVSVINGIPEDGDWQSPVSQNIDLIAPGSRGSVISLRSAQQTPQSPDQYRTFGGTSSAAPHVTGLAALLLSKYNKPCYSNINLDPADIEYIVQKSATHVATNPGYDDSTGWGRLNATAAMDIIDFPRFQIVHPPEPYTNFQLLASDTIPINVNKPLSQIYLGPLASQFPLELTSNYVTVRHKIELTYNFSNYLTPTTSLLDAWIRHSATNSLKEYQDTTGAWVTVGNTGGWAYKITPDTLGIEPMATITELSNDTIKMEGYYYHFIKKYDNLNTDFTVLDPQFPYVNFWYPINPFVDTARMAYSIYIEDPAATDRFDFPCDSANLMYDVYAGLKTIKTDKFKLYPNPSRGEVTVEFGDNKIGKIISLIDLNGREVYSTVLPTGEKSLTFGNQIEAGVYLVCIRTSNNEISIKKWIKQ